MKRPIRVLIADDSSTMRDVLSVFLGKDPGLEVVGLARDGVEAVALTLALSPDVVTMDVSMPRLDGLEATSAILCERPTRVLIISSVAEEAELDLSFRAISAGALELLAKPRGTSGLQEWGAKVAHAIHLMSEVPVVTRRRRASAAQLPPAPVTSTIDVLGIVASTGGPPALARVLSELPSQLPIPILVAQHISEGFTQGLVRWLSRESTLKVSIALSGEMGLPGHVYLAPDGKHLEVDRQGLFVLTRGDSQGHCPSGDKLLASLAQAYGARSGGLVMTGMGSDGAEGLLEIHRAGGQTLAQDESSSVVYGMPAAALKLKATEISLSLEDIARQVRLLAGFADRRRGPGRSSPA